MEPYEIAMLIFVIALEITSATALVVLWVKACKEAKKHKEDATYERT